MQLGKALDIHTGYGNFVKATKVCILQFRQRSKWVICSFEIGRGESQSCEYPKQALTTDLK